MEMREGQVEQAESSSGDFFSRQLSRPWRLLVVTVFFAIALLVRIAGIGWGLPTESRHQSLHPDEYLIALHATERPYLRPDFYNYGTLYFTLLKLATDAGTTYGWIPTGKDTPPWRTLRGVNLAGRWISALAGAAAVALVVLMLLSATSTMGGLVGGAALLVSPGLVVHSRFQTTDLLAVLLISLAAYGLYRSAADPDNPSTSTFVWTALAAGLAAGTKYTGALLLLPLAICLWRLRSDRLSVTARSFAAFAAGFLVATPGVILEPNAFARDFLYEIQHTAAGHGLVFVETPSGFIYHILTLITSFGLVAILAGAAGLCWAAIRREAWALPFLAFVIAYYVVIGRAEVKFVRYAFPLLPFLAVGVGYFAHRLHSLSPWHRLANALLLLALGLSIRAQTGIVTLTAFMMTEDPRDAAAVWLKGKAPNPATIGFVTDPWFYSPPVFPDTGLLGADNRLLAMASFDARLVRAAGPEGRRVEWDPRLVEVERPDYIVFSSFEFIDHDRVGVTDFEKWFEAAAREYRLVAVAWGGEIRESDPAAETSKFDRVLIRRIIHERFPLLHDMMYIQPAICVLKRVKP